MSAARHPSARAGVSVCLPYLHKSTKLRTGTLDLFFAHGISLGEPSGPADIDAEEVQQPGLDAGGFGDGGGVAVVGGDQAQAGERLEDGPAGGPGGGGAVAGQSGHRLAVGGQGFADLPSGQAEDQQGQADHGDQGGDAAVGLEEQGGDREGALPVPASRRNQPVFAVFDGFLAGGAEGGGHAPFSSLPPIAARFARTAVRVKGSRDAIAKRRRRRP